MSYLFTGFNMSSLLWEKQYQHAQLLTQLSYLLVQTYMCTIRIIAQNEYMVCKMSKAFLLDKSNEPIFLQRTDFSVLSTQFIWLVQLIYLLQMTGILEFLRTVNVFLCSVSAMAFGCIDKIPPRNNCCSVLAISSENTVLFLSYPHPSATFS